MELVRAKVKGIEDVVAILGKVTDGDVVTYRGASDRVFTSDEVEELGPYDVQKSQQDPFEQAAMNMMQFMASVLNDVLNRQDAQYWQRQRVEFTKIFLQRSDLNKNAEVKDIVSSADEFVRYLKETDLTRQMSEETDENNR